MISSAVRLTWRIQSSVIGLPLILRMRRVPKTETLQRKEYGKFEQAKANLAIGEDPL